MLLPAAFVEGPFVGGLELPNKIQGHKGFYNWHAYAITANVFFFSYEKVKSNVPTMFQLVVLQLYYIVFN